MLKLTKTGIGLLTRLYRSVLQKCWLINIGVWALGKIAESFTSINTLKGCVKSFSDMLEKLLRLYDLENFDGVWLKFSQQILSGCDKSAGNAAILAERGHIECTAFNVMDSFSENHVSLSRLFKYGLMTSTILGTVMIAPSAAVAMSLADIDTTNPNEMVAYLNSTSAKGENIWSYDENNQSYLNATDNNGVVTGRIGFKLGKNNTTYYLTYTYPYDSNDRVLRSGSLSTYSSMTGTPLMFIGNHNDTSSSNTNANPAVWVSNSLTADFIDNSASAYGNGYSYVVEGVINVSGSEVTGNFIGNHGYTSGYGVYGVLNTGNYGYVTVIGDFIGNYTSNYGSVYNDTQYLTLKDSSFVGNYANARYSYNLDSGAGYSAIDNNSILFMIAEDKDIIFKDNGGVYGNLFYYRDISNYNTLSSGTATLNLSAKEGKSITFNGEILGGGTDHSFINLNTDSTNNGGKIIFNNTVKNNAITLPSNTKPVTLQLGTATQSDGSITHGNFSNVSLTNAGAGNIFDTRNSYVAETTLTSLTLNQPLKLAIDANIFGEQADTISATTITNNAGAGSLIIDSIDLGKMADEYKIQLTNNATLKTAYTLSDDIMDNITGANADLIEAVSYDNTTGILTFTTNSSGGGSGGASSAVIGNILPSTSFLNSNTETAREFGTETVDDGSNNLTVGATISTLANNVYNHLNNNYSRKLTKINTFCDGLDGKIRVANDNTATATTARAVANIFKKAI